MTAKKKKTAAIATALVAAVVLVTSLGGASFAKEENTGEAAKLTYVDILSPSVGSIIVTGEYVGTVEPDQSVTVYPKLAGEVLAVHFGVGDTVNAGDVLCELDARDLQYNVAQTQAAITSAEAKLQFSLDVAQHNLETYRENLENGTNADLLAAEAKVRSAENGVASAHTDLLSARRLYREAKSGETEKDYSDVEIDQLKDSVSTYEHKLESAQLTLETAEETLRAVQKQVADAETSIHDNITLSELNADLSEQRIALQKLQDTLGDASVRAPISGVIEKRSVDSHDMVSPQSSIYVISNKDIMSITFTVPEASLAHIQVGDAVTVEKNGASCTGFITEVTTMADGASGLYPVKASVENAPFAMHTGSTVKVYADTQKAIDSMLLPISCIYFDNGTPYVYIYDNGIARKTVVSIGLSDVEFIEVTSGLSSQDQVIGTWSSNLTDGKEVYLPGEEAANDEQAPSAEEEAAA